MVFRVILEYFRLRRFRVFFRVKLCFLGFRVFVFFRLVFIEVLIVS